MNKVSFPQASNLEYNDVYSNSSNYIFLGLVYKPYQPSYTPDYNSMRSALQQRQARYDYNLDIISNEIQKVRSLKLINLHNISTLTNFQIQLNSEIEKPTSFASWDYSLTENLNRALNYVTSIYNINDIRNELRLLNDLNGFNDYIQNSDPYQVNRGILYDDLTDFIDALKGYNSSELSMSFKDLMDRLRENKFNYSKQNILYKYNSVTKL